MIKKSIGVSNDTESARTVAMLVQIASRYQSSINILQENKTVNAKSIMGMMTLGLVPGQELEITAEGEDEQSAMTSLEEYLVGTAN